MRALISVSDKTGVIEFAKELEALGCTIISTGGTHAKIAESGVKVVGISDVTGFPECLDGRVKTLHPAVHGGILAMREKPEHMAQLKDLGIETIDIVAINLYPFKETILKPDVTLPVAIENIDIGGPTMLRSAAKNHKDVVVICDPADYPAVIAELKEKGEVSYDTKYRLALKVFQHTAAYDTMISDYLRKEAGYGLPDNFTMTFEKAQDLRYGENPHQKAWYYKEVKPAAGDLVNAKQLHGKELSFNTNAAIEALREFDEPAVVAVKHANPCGIGTADNIYEAYMKAYAADPVSIFGGIVASNREITAAVAEEISKIFLEIVIAPSFSAEALEIIEKKKNIRILELPAISERDPFAYDMKKVSGGLLVQEKDTQLYDPADWKVVTEKEPTEFEKKDMVFGMKVVKNVKSNAIVLVRNGQTIGMGPGQVNRVGALEIAIRQAVEDTNGAVLASDAFFPFDDCVEMAAKAGITAIIQPGGSIRDEDSIKKCNEYGISMVFTGMRHFKH